MPLDWTNFELIYAMALAGWPLTWKEKTFLHVRLKRQLNGGRTTFCCTACSRIMFFNDATLEHIVPLSLGGTYEMWNLTLTCGNCNRKRGNKHDFWAWRIVRHKAAHRDPARIMTWTP